MLWNVPCWPPGVAYSSEGICDRARQKLFPLNSTGHILAKQVNGNKALIEMAQTLAEAYGLGLDVAIDDTKLFFLSLNQQMLINFKNAPLRWPSAGELMTAVSTVAANPIWALRKHLQNHPAVWHRKTIIFDSSLKVITEILWLILTRVQALWLILLFGLCFAIAIWPIYVTSHTILALVIMAVPAYVTLSVMLSVAIHETSHALAWHYISGEKQTIIAANHFSVQVVCAQQGLIQEIAIALSGPGINVLLCCISIVAASLFYQYVAAQIALWIFAGIQGVVGIASLFGADGRRAWYNFLSIYDSQRTIADP